MNRHLDESLLFRAVRAELSASESRTVGTHLKNCARCRDGVDGLRQVDRQLTLLREAGRLDRAAKALKLPASDPYRSRPLVRRVRAKVDRSILLASDAGLAASSDYLERILSIGVGARLDRGEFMTPKGRYMLLYALQEAARRIAGGPAFALDFARLVLKLPTAKAAEAGLVPSWRTIRGQAHLLAGQAQIWMRNYKSAGTSLRAAYRGLAATGDETSLAVVELAESQRRTFLRRGREALILAFRCRQTFEQVGFTEAAAKGAVAEGLALASMGRYEEAILTYREALPIFQQNALWSNYVGAVNSLATSLYKAGRLAEAKREFARVLKVLSRDEHRAWLGYLRHGFAEVLLSANRLREAADAFARAAELYDEARLVASSLVTRLAEAECFSRLGDVATTASRLEAISSELDSRVDIDEPTRRSLRRSLARARKDVAEIVRLRQRIPQLVRA